MLYKEFDSLFKKQALSLPYMEGLGLALSVCKRLYFDYEEFVSAEHWGDKDLLLDAIKLCEHAKFKEVDRIRVEEMLVKVEAITPDTEDFGNYLGSYALNAAASVYETLQFIMDKNPLHIYNIGTCLTDTIDFKINEKENLTDEGIDEHKMMLEARNFLLQQTKGRSTTSVSQKRG
jgi:uncharacterized protein YjaG (DUF416 family)